MDYYDQYKHKVYSFFFYRLENEQLAEDLASDTFLKAYEKFETYNNKYAFSTWIYTIAKNILTDYFRKNKSISNIDDIDDHNPLLADEHIEDIEKQVNTALTAEQIKELLHSLPDFQRECILMRYLEELEFSEIAEKTGKTEVAIRKNLSRGMKTLKQKSEILFTIIIFFSHILH